MYVRSLKIKGFRGFANEQTLKLALPNGQIGSGLTILVGPNSGGKSTVVEAVDSLFSPNSTISFAEGKRNAKSNERVSIYAELEDGSTHVLRTADAGGSETIREPGAYPQVDCYFLPSRRFFNPYFNSGTESREGYVRIQSVGTTRSNPINRFSYRLFAINQKRREFDKVLSRVMDPVPDWTIEQSNQGNYYLKLNTAGQSHDSDGLGDGIISLLFIIDALYDSTDSDLIVVDEPELSLHPQYQRRLLRLFAEYARNMQIVYSTHSPYFVDVKHILNGATVARVHKVDGFSTINQLSDHSAKDLDVFLTDIQNPHVLGITAREALFQEDGMIVVEGQEDVVLYPKILEQLVTNDLLDAKLADCMNERFFGWGAGGADKIERILSLLRDLGFQHVAVIVDKNKEDELPALKCKFEPFRFGSIPADDVRSKSRNSSQTSALGLLDENRALRQQFVTETARLFTSIGEYVSSKV